MSGSVCFAIKKGNKIQSFSVDTRMLRLLTGYPLFEQADHDQLLEKYSEHVDESELAPYSYGLVAVDVDQKWIGDMQDYTGLGKFNYFPGIDQGSEWKTKYLELIWDHQLFEKFSVMEMGVGAYREAYRKDFDAATFSEFLVEIQKKFGSASYGFLGDLILKDWTVEPFKADETPQFFEKLLDFNWVFSDHDLKAWTDFSKDSFNAKAILAKHQKKHLNDHTASVHNHLRKARI